MKYYHQTKTINIGTPNEYIYEKPYDLNELPLDKPIYGFAYDINDDTEYKRLICKPILGCICQLPKGRTGYYTTHLFVPYKVGTHERRKSGAVSFRSRMYADTYEEAVEMFNELVQKRINNLQRMIIEAKNDLLPTGGNYYESV